LKKWSKVWSNPSDFNKMAFKISIFVVVSIFWFLDRFTNLFWIGIDLNIPTSSGVQDQTI